VTIRWIDEGSVGEFFRTAEIVLSATMDEETERKSLKVPSVLKGLTHRTSAFASVVHAAVRSGKLAQPFSAETVKRACPGYTDGTYRNFFNRHRVGNPGGMAELYVRRGANRFEIADSN
jgi:hypothetical protein